MLRLTATLLRTKYHKNRGTMKMVASKKNSGPLRLRSHLRIPIIPHQVEWSVTKPSIVETSPFHSLTCREVSWRLIPTLRQPKAWRCRQADKNYLVGIALCAMGKRRLIFRMGRDCSLPYKGKGPRPHQTKFDSSQIRFAFLGERRVRAEIYGRRSALRDTAPSAQTNSMLQHW